MALTIYTRIAAVNARTCARLHDCGIAALLGLGHGRLRCVRGSVLAELGGEVERLALLVGELPVVGLEHRRGRLRYWPSGSMPSVVPPKMGVATLCMPRAQPMLAFAGCRSRASAGCAPASLPVSFLQSYSSSCVGELIARQGGGVVGERRGSVTSDGGDSAGAPAQPHASAAADQHTCRTRPDTDHAFHPLPQTAIEPPIGAD